MSAEDEKQITEAMLREYFDTDKHITLLLEEARRLGQRYEKLAKFLQSETEILHQFSADVFEHDMKELLSESILRRIAEVQSKIKEGTMERARLAQALRKLGYENAIKEEKRK